MRAIIPFILSAMLFAGACHAPKDIVYKDVQHFSLKQAGLQHTTLAMDVRLYNPNRYSLKLKRSDIDVFLNGSPLGKINIESGIDVAKLDTSAIPVTLDVNSGEALSGLMKAAFGGDITIKLTGTIRAGRHGIFVRVPVNYEGKQDALSGLLKM